MMKIMRFAIGSVVSSILFFSYTSANANVTLSINLPSVENICASIANSNWSGSGKATGAMDCNYKGSGTVMGSAPNYKLQIHAEKSGGNFFCPKSVDTTLNATCLNNAITIYNDNVNLNGAFNGSNQIDASGTVGFLGITDKLTMTVRRTG